MEEGTSCNVIDVYHLKLRIYECEYECGKAKTTPDAVKTLFEAL